MSDTVGERSERAIDDPREREAVALLAQAGWTHAELAMCFAVSESSIGRVLASVSPTGVPQ